MDYKAFLSKKKITVKNAGVEIDRDLLNPVLFEFQKDLVTWAARKGRCAIFADTGLGKTMMQLEWARVINQRVLIIAPLTVAKQTVKEAASRLGMDVRYVRSQAEATDDHLIYITNYEMIHHFDPDWFGAVVLDESSILKSLDGKTRHLLTDMFAQTPYRLCCSATPAPNDVTEIGRHAEFLGIMSNAEMLAAFFINDQKMKNGTYRLKRHAVEPFYEWLASWGMAIKKPSDLGYEDNGYILPPLNTELITIETQYTPEGMLPGFGVNVISAIEAKSIRRESIDERVNVTAELVNGTDTPWVVWCDLNAESEALAKAIPGSINVYGAMSPEDKADALMSFVDGQVRVLITKPTIAGFGINMQHCSNMAFCGIGYSWEQYYQAVRRVYRFGQKNPVSVFVVTSEQERMIFDLVTQKEKEAAAMTDQLVKRSNRYAQLEIKGEITMDWEYKTNDAGNDRWSLWLGDSVERIAEMQDNSVDLSVFSPPFISLYTYTPTERDMGNSRNEEEFFNHFQPIIDELLRITKPGRNCCVHVQQVATTKANDGVIGIKDFRGDVIRAFTGSNWTFHGEVTIDKNPQVQAIRTKTKGLMFVQLHKDSCASRPAFADYILIFQKPGENEVPVVPDVSNEEWIEWAHPVWYDIRESDVLNVKAARDDRDERHICPLQLPVIERCVRLYTNKNELVFDPFAGIGSTGDVAIRHGRRFHGIELKPEYFQVAVKNLQEAQQIAGLTLFDLMAANND